MKRTLVVFLTFAMCTAFVPAARADATAAECAEAVKAFQNAGQSAEFFKNSYGYAIYPTIGKAGLGIGGAHGSGCVFVKGNQVAVTTFNQLSFGWQAGAEGFSLITFFQDEKAFKEFASGKFQFGVQASAVAIRTGAAASAGTGGAGTTASAGKADATKGGYQKGVAVFSMIKGGLMYEAVLGGAKLSYKPI